MNKLICPNCGSEFELPDESHLACGMTLAKSGGNTTYEMPLAVAHNNNTKESNNMMNKRDSRMAQMTAAGITNGNFFSVMSDDGREMRFEFRDGVPTFAGYAIDETEDDDYIYDPKIGRRWIMAQTFRMLNDGCGWSAYINRKKPYVYQWDVVLQEYKQMAKMEASGDRESLNERLMFWSAEIVNAMMNDYCEKLYDMCIKLPHKNCKGIPYIHFHGRDIFVADIRKKVVNPARYYASKFYYAHTMQDKYRVLESFVKYARKYKLCDDVKKSPEFVEAFKGAGAFYTMQNMIMYHDCKFEGISRDDSMDYVKTKAKNCGNAGFYTLHGALKELVKVNNFHFAE